MDYEKSYQEDEEMRKWIIDNIRYNMNYNMRNETLLHLEYKKKAAKAIAWLERQCNNADKFKPKFNVGDWVVNKFGDSWHIDSFDKKNYQVSDGKGNYNYFPILKQDEMHLWSIEDAKEGDVLATDKGVFIYAKVLYNKPYAYCGVDKFGVFKDNCLNNNWTNSVDNIHPATKEKRDLLFAKMKEEGYRWDEDKKEVIRYERFVRRTEG